MNAFANDRPIPVWLILGTTVALSVLVGWLDYNASEVQPAVLMLVVFAAVLSYLDPPHAWLVALLLGLSIAGTHIVAKTAGLHPVTPSDSPVATLLALIPSSIGAAIGASLRLLATRSRRA